VLVVVWTPPLAKQWWLQRLTKESMTTAAFMGLEFAEKLLV
jgi:hypothetical protein